jgi:hypothetical protein
MNLRKLKLVLVTSNFLMVIRRIKHKLITKLITRIEVNLRDEFVKSNIINL